METVAHEVAAGSVTILGGAGAEPGAAGIAEEVVGTRYSAKGLDLFALSDPRRQYLNIASLYYRPIDPLTELIQNALASILERQAVEPNHRGLIRVVIDVADRSFTVEDNGRGFRRLDDIAANRTTRDIAISTPHSGFGIGLSSVVSRSDEFTVRSVNIEKELHEAEWLGARERVNNGSALTLEPATCTGPVRSFEAPRTTIRVKGDEGFADLWKLASEDAHALYERLVCHSALGHTSYIWDRVARPRCDYQVIIRGGSEPVNEKRQVGFPFAEVGEASTFDYERFTAGELPTKDQLIIYKKKGRKSSVRPYRPRVNIYVACEIERGQHFEKRFGRYVESLSTNRILLSINGFLQSFAIERPAERRTRALWGNVFVILETDGNVVEPGRNRIADLYVRDIEEALKEAIGRLDKLVTEVRDREKYGNAIDVEVEKRTAETNASTNPLDYAIGKRLHLLKVPEDEQEVIALFFELVGNGSIEHVDTLRVGGGANVYDAYLRYTFTWSDVGDAARPKSGEGRRSLDLTRKNEKVLVTEFKRTAGDLVSEIAGGKTRKKLDQLDLLVCWAEGNLPADYTLDPLDEDERFLPAATHVLRRRSGGRSETCEVIVLMDLLERLEMGLGS